ncbi:P-loop NTPase [Pseudonocardia zijingensis]|uniref:Iron-sulfur cluster carrier protein n=1 Tax=Pseudonocardia zijingensis TaxID=153376 RepID=A0ABP3ZHJ1_9PSEU
MSSLLGRHADVDAGRVRAAVAAVTDPELGLPLGGLGMIGEVHVGRGGRAHIELRLTTASCPLAAELTGAVTEAARQVPGIRQVSVDTRAMSVRERSELADRLRRDTARIDSVVGEGRPAVYAVASGKGGVGKSTVTANLAAAPAARGKRVGVLDADVWGYSIPQLFGVRRNPVVLGDAMLPVPAHGVMLMSVGFFVDEDSPVVWRGPMLRKAIEQFLRDTHWGRLDTLLVDLPPGTGDAALSLLELLPDAALLAVTPPQTAARVVARRMVRMATDAGSRSPGSWRTCPRRAAPPAAGRHRSSARAAARCSQRRPAPRCSAGYRSTWSSAERADAGRPVVLASPEAASARELARIAAALPSPRRSLAHRPLPLSAL